MKKYLICWIKIDNKRYEFPCGGYNRIQLYLIKLYHYIYYKIKNKLILLDVKYSPNNIFNAYNVVDKADKLLDSNEFNDECRPITKIGHI